MLYCENQFCLFNENFTCQNGAVSIDVFGHCDSCVLVELNTGKLTHIKHAQLQTVKEVLTRLQNEQNKKGEE